jgi:large subunit ribosomal protein L9
MKAGEGGKLYGKVTNKEIAKVLHSQLGFEVDKRAIRTSEDITALGTYRVFVRLTADVQSELVIEVLPEGAVPGAKSVDKKESISEEAPAADQEEV